MKNSMMKLTVAAVAVMLSACASSGHRAPIAERHVSEVKSPVKSPAREVREAKEPGQKDWRPKNYTVQKGDTLYSIALEHGLDYRELAQMNGINNPDMIRIGQSLQITASDSGEHSVTTALPAGAPLSPAKPLAGGADETKVPAAAVADTEMLKTQPRGIKLPYSEQALAQLQNVAVKPAADIKSEAKVDAKPEAKPAEPSAVADESRVDWGWPVAGKIINGFSETANLKGIDIAGKAGQTIAASAPGKVVYTGSGLRGYGKLIIIKHNRSYLSAYAHNSLISVKEGQMVNKGEKIGEMGNTDAEQTMLHFEIRYLGKPVDPMKYLKE